MTFTDTFNRADGTIGNGWTVHSGAATIASQRLSCTQNAILRQTGVENATDQTASITLASVTTADVTSGPIVKMDVNGNAGYRTQLYGNSGAYSARIYKLGAGSPLFSASFPHSIPTPSTFTIVYRAGMVYFYINGDLAVSGADDSLDLNTFSGIQLINLSTGVDEFTCSGSALLGFTVTPEAVNRNLGAQTLYFTGLGTAWTPGIPGSPTFTVSDGSLSDQLVMSATYASALFTPPESDMTVTVTDPSTDLTDTVEVNTTGVPTGGGGGGECKLTDDGAQLVNDTADQFLPGHILTDAHVVILSPLFNIPDAISYLITLVRNLYPDAPPWDPGEVARDPRLDLIWNAINGGVEQPVGLWSPTTDQPVKLDTEESLAKLTELTTQYTDLADVVAMLGGSPTVLSHADLKLAIDNIDLSTITDKLDSIQGSQLISITDLAGQLQLIRTIAGYSLGDVLAAISALNPATAPGLAAALATIMGSLGGLALEIAAIGAAETEDAAASSAGAASAAAALAWLLANGPVILDMLHDVQELLASSGNAAPHPPVWPGLANVDLGAAVDLATTNTLAGPMHGVLLDISSADPGTNRYVYDTVPAWKNIGALSFFTDTGHHETYQALSFAQALYVPKSMAVAGGVRVFHGRGPQGTIRPWSYKT